MDNININVTEIDKFKITILVVDDLQANLFAMSKMLETLKVSVLLAKSATEGLKYLLNEKVDLVLLDYSMPDMSGIEMSQIIQQQFKEPPPILFITAHGTFINDLEKSCYESGAIDFIEKPIKEHILLSKLRVLIDLILQKEKLKNLATTDSLTNLKNRLSFHEMLDYNLSLCQRQGRTIALLALDLDGFKSINDLHGHGVGDDVLVEFANILRACSRESDVIARLGGDEFCILLTGIFTEDEAIHVAKKIIKKCKSPYIHEQVELTIRTSIGIALAPLHAQSRGELTRLADKALYDAKSSGKGVVRVYSQHPEDAAELRDISKHLTFDYKSINPVKSASSVAISVKPNIIGSNIFKSFDSVTDFANRLSKQQQLMLTTCGTLLKELKKCETKATNNKLIPVFLKYPYLNSKNTAQQKELYQLSKSLIDIGFSLVVVTGEAEDLLRYLEDDRYKNILLESKIEFCIDDVGATQIPTRLLSKSDVKYLFISNKLTADLNKTESNQKIVHSIIDIAKAFDTTSIVSGDLNDKTLNLIKSFGCQWVEQ